MKKLIEGKLEGLYEPMKQFSKKLDAAGKGKRGGNFNKLILEEMNKLGFSESMSDRFDNVVGTMNGFRQDQDIALVFNIGHSADGKETADTRGSGNYNPGIVTALYSAAVLKRALLPLNGNIYVCGVPRSECCGFGVKYLFEYYLAKKLKNLKGVILNQPTDMNIYLGHKGRMEYEIVVKVRLGSGFLESRGINMLGTMFPLIHELEAVSHRLPSNCSLGSSSLRIKDVSFCGTKPQDGQNEFRVIVDRSYIPEEQQENILERAKMIAQSVYRGEDSVSVRTAVAKEKIKTYDGASIISEKEIKPWAIDATHPFVLSSLQTLTDNGMKANFGYWKEILTDGSYTFGKLGIPTFGFGPEQESTSEGTVKACGPEAIKKAVFAQSLMIHRSIGVPTFGWSSDEV